MGKIFNLLELEITAQNSDVFSTIYFI